MQRINLPGLTVTPERIELAYQDGVDVFVVRIAARPGAPADPTKLEYDCCIFLLNDDGDGVLNGDGELVRTRNTTLTIYNDPSEAVQTPAEMSRSAVVLAKVEEMLVTAKPWADRVHNRDLFVEALAPAEELPPLMKDGQPVAVSAEQIMTSLRPAPPPAPEPLMPALVPPAEVETAA